MRTDNSINSRLGDVIELKRGYDLPTARRNPGSIPIISSSGPNGAHDEAKVRGPGVVTGRYGTIGRVYYVESDFWPLNTSLYVRDFKGHNPRFIYYFLQGINWERFNDKSGVPGINRNHAHDALVSIPPVGDQGAIAQILAALDDKIELNRRMNETLEAMARAIFKDWFVDFGPTRAKAEGRPPYLAPELWELFPDSLDDDGKPIGWRVSSLGERIEILDFKRIPLSSQQRTQRQGPYPYHGATGVMDHVDNFLFDGVHVLLGEDGSVVKPNGEPFTQYVWGQFWVNNHAHVLRGKGISNEMLLCFLQQTDIAPYVTGAVQLKLNQKNLKSIPFSASDSDASTAFEGVVDSLFEQFRRNSEEIRTLAQTRDLLLPKLMSGEIRLREAEKAIEAIA